MPDSVTIDGKQYVDLYIVLSLMAAMAAVEMDMQHAESIRNDGPHTYDVNIASGLLKQFNITPDDNHLEHYQEMLKRLASLTASGYRFSFLDGI